VILMLLMWPLSIRYAFPYVMYACVANVSIVFFALKASLR
jgi:hypothetical protein